MTAPQPPERKRLSSIDPAVVGHRLSVLKMREAGYYDLSVFNGEAFKSGKEAFYTAYRLLYRIFAI